MPSAQLEQQFQARIAQAKEAARLASIAASARASCALIGPSLAPITPVSTTFQSSAPVAESFQLETVPIDVKNRVDRLVEFVARNGIAFELTVKQREQKNPDFAFLNPGGPFSDYYEWKKQQQMGEAPVSGQSPVLGSAFPAASVMTDVLGDMSVGAMANVCKFAKVSGVQPYAPIPPEVILRVGSLPSVEPARLELDPRQQR
uniref:SURP motif domain-containing protein n=1 Tax=Hyaloperonospora arabidopsidis (strain Emoy2) TaxID=559515 RepID=M4BSH8_HYAAE